MHYKAGWDLDMFRKPEERGFDNSAPLIFCDYDNLGVRCWEWWDEGLPQSELPPPFGNFYCTMHWRVAWEESQYWLLTVEKYVADLPWIRDILR